MIYKEKMKNKKIIKIINLNKLFRRNNQREKIF